MQAERPVVIRPEQPPVRNNRFGPAGAAALRSTPLERPTLRRTEENRPLLPENEPERRVETSVSYREYMAQQRKKRAVLATGDDRR